MMKPHGFTVFIIAVFLGVACGPSRENQKTSDAAKNLTETAVRINDDFIQIRKEVLRLAELTVTLYDPENIMQNSSAANRSAYRLHENGVLYKPVNDGKSAVFVSGYVPVDEAIQSVVYATEPLDAVLREIVEKFPEVVQAYYNDRNSYNRIYPYFDVITQYEPKMNIPSFNFYYLADERHNPEKKPVWVREPYVDPAGRGWMISAIAPVYVNGRLEGVPGLDVTITTITDRYIDREDTHLILLDSTGTIVSIPDHLTSLLSLPPLENHRYLETIRMDTYRTDDFNLLKSKTRNVREMAAAVFEQNRKETLLSKDGEEFQILAEDIPELGWKLLCVLY